MLWLIATMVGVTILGLAILGGITRVFGVPDGYLDPISAMMLRCEEEAINTIHICAQLESRVSVGTFTPLFASAFVSRHARMQERVVMPWLGWPYWERIPASTFDVSSHIRAPLGEDSTLSHAQLEAQVSALLGSPLPLDAPLWDVSVFYMETGHTAFVFRVHHALGDGVTLARMFFAGLQNVVSPFGAAQQSRPRRVRPAREPRSASSLLRELPTALRSLVFSAEDPPSPFKRAHGDGITPHGERVCALATVEGLELDDVKAAAARLGVTVNDVLLAGLSGVLRLQAIDGGVEHPNSIRTVLWVSLQSLRAMYLPLEADPLPEWGNRRLGFVYVTLPLDEPDPVERARIIHAETARLLHSPMAILGGWLMHILGLLPGPILRAFWPYIAFKVTMSMSNMPGPAGPVTLGGIPVTSVAFFVPPQGRVGLFATLYTMNGHIGFGLAADKRIAGQETMESGVHSRFMACLPLHPGASS